MNTATPISLIVSCEHGGNRIPAPYRHLFADAQALLATHRGYDAGALDMARRLARAFDAPLVISTVSRLLVDLNRSAGHRALYSERSRALSAIQRESVLAAHYRPYRDRVESTVERAIATGRCVVHISSHSFTPMLDGERRNADVSLLYDPKRPGERALCDRWSKSLGSRIDPLKVRRNYPYQGRNDGLTSHLRRRFAPGLYIGVELEMNQKHVRDGRIPAALVRAVIESLREGLDVVVRRRPRGTGSRHRVHAAHVSGMTR
ncbi:MAG TPA: N-formylglutamate amidohydrolase [Casimicrobiaceae bacterium]